MRMHTARASTFAALQATALDPAEHPPDAWPQAAMRILHVIAGAATGGAETFCLDAIAALAERGIEQRVICRPHPQATARLGAAEVPYEPLSFTPASRLVGGPAAIRRAATDWRADLVHAWMSRAASFIPVAMPCPVIGWLGGYYNLKYF